MTADRDSWCDQADQRATDAVTALNRAEAAEAQVTPMRQCIVELLEETAACGLSWSETQDAARELLAKISTTTPQPQRLQLCREELRAVAEALGDPATDNLHTYADSIRNLRTRAEAAEAALSQVHRELRGHPDSVLTGPGGLCAATMRCVDATEALEAAAQRNPALSIGHWLEHYPKQRAAQGGEK
jgi:ATP-dependent Lon protease